MNLAESLTLEALELARLGAEHPIPWAPKLGLQLVTRWDELRGFELREPSSLKVQWDA